jgi:hypothetical protein
MIQQEFAERSVRILRGDNSVIGLTVGGSWLTNELDEFSDLDLILVTTGKITDDVAKMKSFAKRLGDLLSAFTGEHVGEPRLLICLYDNPLLHVDIKFLTLEEFRDRVETPIILLDKHDQLKTVIVQTQSTFPYPDYQWIEDRFWVWIHYALLKLGRGEYVEAFDFFSFLRSVVLGPLLHIKNGNLPKGVRKVESRLVIEDFELLKSTLPQYEKSSLIDTLQNAISLYRQLRAELFTSEVILQVNTENRVIQYMNEVKGR